MTEELHDTEIHNRFKFMHKVKHFYGYPVNSSVPLAIFK
jgi:hypothetical protein